MRKVIMWNIITLDGYFEGKANWDLSFHEKVWGKELEQLSREQLDSAGALLFGRVTYEGMAAYWSTAKNEGEITPRMNAIQKIVCSNTLASADWNNTRLVTGDAADAVARLKEEPGGDLYLFGSAILSDSLTKRGLIDEYKICVAPTILGEGRPLFAKGTSRPLKLLDSTATSQGGVILRYAPA